MARNDVVNVDGSINYTAIGGFKDRLDGHDLQLAQMMTQYFGVSVENFKIQTGETDDTARIQRAINSISSGFVVLANKTYNITTLTMKTGVFLYSLNATLKQIANAPANNNMIYFQGVSNTGVLGAITIDGNRSNNTGNTQMGIKIVQGCSDLYFGTLFIKNTNFDGFYVGGVVTPQPQNIHVQKMIVDNAGRNGISITSGQDMFFGDIVTRNTTGVAPQAGVDIETNNSSDTLNNINFDSLTSYGNVGAGLQTVGYDLTNLSQGKVTIKRLICRNNTSVGFQITGVSYIEVLSGEISYNTLVGISIPRNARHTRIKSNIHHNGGRGIDMALTSQNLQSYDFDFSGCRIYDNSQTTANSADGIRIDSDDATKLASRIYLLDVSLYDDQATPTQRYGISTGTNTERIKVTGDMFGNATSSYLIGGTKTKIINTEQSGTLATTAQTIGANSTYNFDLTVSNMPTGARLIVNPNTMPAGIMWSAWVTSATNIRIIVANITTGSISLPAITWYYECSN